ncbi:DUF3301 domain-containing protein [Dyella subtropica]|uniref:DUF3301 domain-containing protein n=1 Tax=Dyella subtropica TaxID=2992127 RepID=UPI0022519FA7|nr:DUF3301 domain-containing protein [Dyella subtropica]
MSKLSDLMLLLALLGVIGLWLKLSRARELAMVEARRQCERHGLQLLDETVGLRTLRLRRLDGRRVWERSYSFEVSIDGNDREPGRLWVVEGRLTGLSLPTIETRIPGDAATTRNGSNVIPLRPGLNDESGSNRRLH